MEGVGPPKGSTQLKFPEKRIRFPANFSQALLTLKKVHTYYTYTIDPQPESWMWQLKTDLTRCLSSACRSRHQGVILEK